MNFQDSFFDSSGSDGEPQGDGNVEKSREVIYNARRCEPKVSAFECPEFAVSLPILFAVVYECW